MRTAFALLFTTGCSTPSTQVVAVTPSSVPVQVAVVEEGEFDESWTLDGVVRPRQHALLAAQATGEIRQATVSSGAVVEEGDLLFEIDSALIKARMEAARAEMAEYKAISQAQYGLRSNLRSTAGGPTLAAEADKAGAKGTEYDARAKAARARLETLSVELVRHEVRAPWRGLFARRYVDVGDYVFHGDLVGELVSLGEVEVEVDAPAAAVGGIEPGQTCTLEGDDTLVGEILAVIPVIDTETGTVRVRILPNEPRPWLVAGAGVGVRLPMSKNQEGRVVPREALVRRPSGPHVIRVVEGKAMHTQVRVLARSEYDLLLDVGGLEPGDQVVTVGRDGLRPGQLLQVVDE